MSARTYSIYLNSPVDERLLIITDFVSLEYVRSVNVPGALKLVLPKDIGVGLFKKDSRLEIWRGVSAGQYLETKTQWLLDKVIFDDDRQTITVMASSLLKLLDRRIIAYDAGTSESTKSGAADTIMREFVDENMGSSATDTDRDWSNNINIPTPPGFGATTKKSASRRNLLKTCQEIALDSTIAGTPLFFDIEYDPVSKKLSFETFTQQRGVDLTSGQSKITLSPDYGTLSKATRIEDYTKEITFAYAAGTGVGSDRIIQTSSDTDRINESPFGRIEKLIDSRNTGDSADLASDALTAVRNGRPLKTFQGKIVDTFGVTYGINWNWGDRLNAEIDKVSTIARLDTIQVAMSGGLETINVAIRSET